MAALAFLRGDFDVTEQCAAGSAGTHVPPLKLRVVAGHRVPGAHPGPARAG
jgi:hypothetical protein